MTEVSLPCGEVKVIPRPYEEKAYAYADKQAEIYRGLKEPSGGYANVVDAYIAGAKENSIQWHDLRKDPNDLPKEDCEVFAITESDGSLYEGFENYYLDKTDTFDGWGTCQKVIAWCEIPKFEEEA